MSQGYANAPVGPLPFTGLDIWVFVVAAVLVFVTAMVLRKFGK